MNVQERIQQQLGALLLANIQLGAENEALRAQVSRLTPSSSEERLAEAVSDTAEPYPDKNLSSPGGV